MGRIKANKKFLAASTAAIFFFILVLPQYPSSNNQTRHNPNNSKANQQQDTSLIEKEGASRAEYQRSRSAWLRVAGQVLIGGLIIVLILLLVKKRVEANDIVGKWRMTFFREGRDPYSETYQFVGNQTDGEVRTESTMRGAYHVRGYLVEWTFFTHASHFQYAGRFTSSTRMEGNAQWTYLLFPEKNVSGTWTADKIKE